MFSSLSSFLPSGLHLGPNGGHSHDASHKPGSQPPVAIDEEEEHDAEDGERKKKKKEKGVNETFIFVRPPPAKSNHPLNLQVQLVPPNTKGPSGLTPRHSADDGEVDTSGEELTRTQSNRSDVSAYSDASGTHSSYASSTTSFSSVSTSSTSSSRRMIVPLYNLQAHNVMTNTIVDAGTDAKIAKFLKKSIEVIDLAVLEPIEVWALNNSEATAGSRFIQRPTKASQNSRPVTPDPSTPIPHNPSPPRGSPESSALSVSSAGFSVPDPHTGQAIPLDPSATSPRKRNIFGKMFKKKEGAESSASTLMPSSSSVTATPKKSSHSRSLSDATSSFLQVTPLSFGGHARRSTSSNRSSLIITPGMPMPSQFGEFDTNTPGTAAFLNTPGLTPNPSTFSTTSTIAGSTINGQVLLPATLDLHPTLSSLLPFPFPLPPVSVYPPHLKKFADPSFHDSIPRGPAMYVWIVRKWLKRDPSFLNSMGMGSLAGKSLFSPDKNKFGENSDLTTRVEFRVEWRKGKGAKSLKKEKEKLKQRTRVESNPGAAGNSRRGSRIDIMVTPTPTESNTSLVLTEESHAESKEKDKRRPVKRNSLITAVTDLVGDREHKTSIEGNHSRRNSLSRRPGTPSKLGGGSGNGTPNRRESSLFNGEDDGDESDPEDSETPWVCTVKVRRVVDGVPTKSDKPSSVLKLKAATLSPTPHHPKVVAMLKVPFPLPDLLMGGAGDDPNEPGPGAVLVQRESGRGPASPPLPSSGSHGHPPGTLSMSAEELKDLICSTGLWLVVREGFGGIGKVGRKGDGWRIRA
ncbi:hypothetical protein C8J56DRAFT_839458 [Mycena floridula]|nr:hypothetical protein C8J56DRAFT_839458 [Mycena floridula]